MVPSGCIQMEIDPLFSAAVHERQIMNRFSPNLCTPETVLRWERPTLPRGPTMYACKSLKIQGNLCIEFYAQKCERNSISGRRIFIGFPDKLAKPAFYAGLVSLDFTGDNRRGASQRSNQCADCCSTQKSVHKSGDNEAVPLR